MKSEKFLINLIFVFILLIKSYDFYELNDISCKNENNDPIDWFYLYKLPKLVENKIPYVNNGSAYVYMTEFNQKWTLSQHSINETGSLPGITMNILYKNLTLSELNDLGIGYVLYNDQADTVSITKGHTKGVLIFNGNTVVWIVHSIPHFPPKIQSNHYYINSSQLIYGQSMLCLTMKYELLEQIGAQLLYNYPQVYDFFIPNTLLKKDDVILDNLLKVVKGNHVKQEPWFNLAYLQTLNRNHQFLSFAKFTAFSDDLYTMLVAPQLTSNLETETWNNGAGTLPSNCTLKYHVYNIEQVGFDFLNLTFSVHHDHSKWAVSVVETSNVTIACVGDINRQIEQYKRAGGTICILNNQNIWKEYQNLVKNYDTC